MAILTFAQLESVLIGAVEAAQRIFATKGRPVERYPSQMAALWDAFASCRDHQDDDASYVVTLITTVN